MITTTRFRLIRTPRFLAPLFYAALATRPRVGDEAAAVSIGPAYLGIYRTHNGFEVVYGILNEQEAL